MVEHDRAKERVNFGQKIIAFIGPEGSGKSTIAKNLAKETNKPYISTSQILHYLADNDRGYCGDKVREVFENNTYLDGKLLLEIICNRFKESDVKNGFVLDGGFRTVEETQNFLSILKETERDYPVSVIFLKIPREVSMERLITGVNARKRKDDTEAGLNSRLDKFYFQLGERLKIIKNNPNWEIIEIDATPPIANVYENVCNTIR